MLCRQYLERQPRQTAAPLAPVAHPTTDVVISKVGQMTAHKTSAVWQRFDVENENKVEHWLCQSRLVQHMTMFSMDMDNNL